MVLFTVLTGASDTVASKYYHSYFFSLQLSVDLGISGEPVDVLIKKQIVLLLIAHLICGLESQKDQHPSWGEYIS